MSEVPFQPNQHLNQGSFEIGSDYDSSSVSSCNTLTGNVTQRGTCTPLPKGNLKPWTGQVSRSPTSWTLQSFNSDNLIAWDSKSGTSYMERLLRDGGDLDSMDRSLFDTDGVTFGKEPFARESFSNSRELLLDNKDSSRETLVDSVETLVVCRIKPPIPRLNCSYASPNTKSTTAPLCVEEDKRESIVSSMENGTKTEATSLPNGVQAKPADLETGTLQ
ncbi:uncharacterized protein LOC111716154 [Eurytemora carolleeae]|uniref:uncharacterized protein LOC111716154 n=1 Tax=Eurytemora carolleeae TaxID=1294199 RepID=UPI000C758FF9|nr:uncharacterized protein LOC111716154 [Eurytemora carolleeae]|eukprot:XP_023347351.1 uncharacterized protein LOC111716154 [Eurytemora affinis]